MTDLTKLQLCGGDFVAELSRPLGCLRSLSLDYNAAGQVATLLDPTIVPSLSALGLWLLTEPEGLEVLEKSQVSKLLPQLDSLSIHADLYVHAGSTLFGGLSSRILVDFCTYDPQLLPLIISTANHLRIHKLTSSVQDISGIEQLSSLITSQLEDEPHQLRSIYLDSSLIQSGTTVLSRAVETLIEECNRGKIEIIFEAEVADYDVDPYISEEFRRRQSRNGSSEEETRSE